MGDRPVATIRNTEGSTDALVAPGDEAIDRQLRFGCVVALAYDSGHPPSRLGPHRSTGTEQLALSAGNLCGTVRIEMGTADDRAPQAEGRELVSAPNESATIAIGPASTSLLGVREGYERWAPSYDQSPNPVLAREERYIEPLITDVQGKNFLDLACGTGRWLQKASARGVDCGVGVDCSNAMLQVARRKSSIQARLIQADCLHLPLPSHFFDLLICSFALAHIADLQKMICECVRVIKADGEVIVSDLHPEAFVRGWRTGFRDAGSAVHIEVFPRSADEIVRTFYAAGLECLKCESLFLGEPEQQIFVTANKADEFVEACQVPAVMVCRFAPRRLSIEN